MSTTPAPVRQPRKQGALVKAYLFLYNAVACVGWSIVLYTTVKHFLDGGRPQDLYPKIEYWLKIAQTLALVEVLNSILGFVSSPVFTTLMQVASRLYILWGVLNLEGDAHYTVSFSTFLLKSRRLINLMPLPV
jgi:very-long-chain (3R)-3-hydroxyacyl-CoA dehydratase